MVRSAEKNEKGYGQRSMRAVFAAVSAIVFSMMACGFLAAAGEAGADDYEETVAFLVDEDGAEVEISQEELEALRAVSFDEVPEDIEAVIVDPEDIEDAAVSTDSSVSMDNSALTDTDTASQDTLIEDDFMNDEEVLPEEFDGGEDLIYAALEEETDLFDAQALEERTSEELAQDVQAQEDETQAEQDVQLAGAGESEYDGTGEGLLGGGNAVPIDFPLLRETVSAAFDAENPVETSGKRYGNAGSVYTQSTPVHSSYYNVNITQSGSVVSVQGTVSAPYAFYGLFVDTTRVAEVTGYSVNSSIDMNSFATGYHTVTLGLAYYPPQGNPSFVELIGRKYMVSNTIYERPDANGRFEVYSNYFNYYPYNVGYQNSAGDLYLEYSADKGKTWKRSGYMRSNLIQLLPTQGYKIGGLKAKKVYKTRIRYGTYVTYSTSYEGDGIQYFFGGPVLNTTTIKTGASVKPPIKSVTAKAVNVKYHKIRHYGKYTGVYLYTEKFYTCKVRVTVVMKKKPGTKGLFINNRWLKGNRLSYTTTFTPYPNYYSKHPRGRGRFSLSIMSGQNKSWGGYSPVWSKTKRLS